MSIAILTGSMDSSRLMDRMVRIRAEFAARRRRAREAAQIDVFNDHLLRDMGLRRDRSGPNRHLVHF